MKIIKALLPATLKAAIKRTRLYYFYARRSKHAKCYTQEFFAQVVDSAATQSAPIIAKSLFDVFHPQRVLDVGCGTGALLAAFANLGVAVEGLEYSDIGMQFCRSRGIPVRKFDLEQSPLPSRVAADLTVSLEVAEHLQEPYADRYVRLLCTAKSPVVFTAATPGQGGIDHVNEQPQQYWIDRFTQQGYYLCEELTRELRELWERKEVTWWYHRNLMIFKRDGAARLK